MNSERLRVIVADDEPLLAEEIVVFLQDAGYEVVATAADGDELVEKCLTLKPDLVVTDIKMPRVDGLEAVKKICETAPVPVVIVSAYHDQDFIDRATDQCIMSYLVKPVDEPTLKTSIALAMRRFREFEALFSETAELKQTLKDRKIIERAKGVLMKQAKLSEEEAFLRLQKLARKKAQKMVDVASTIIETAEILDI